MPTLLDASQKSRHGTWLEIRLDRLLGNLKAIRAAGGPFAQVLAVIKANAYGHGLKEVARALASEVSFLGVSSVAEVLELKESGIHTPIFLFGRILPPEIPAVLTNGVTLSVSSLDEAATISQAAGELGKKVPIHVKVDTGMGRLGLSYTEAAPAIEKMAALAGIVLEGIYTHFPTAERDDGFTERQMVDFAGVLTTVEMKGVHFKWRHAANSAASLKLRTPFFNLIRPGLMLYGIYPHDSLRDLAAVSPILSLKTRMILVKRIEAGQSVGYGRDFTAKGPTNIATLPVGYSHGYPFQASNRACVLYQGKRFPLAGRVSMDYLTVNLGDTPARAGDEVTLLGEDGGEKISAEELAGWCGTIPYEIVTRLSSKLPRFYLT